MWKDFARLVLSGDDTTKILVLFDRLLDRVSIPYSLGSRRYWACPICFWRNTCKLEEPQLAPRRKRTFDRTFRRAAHSDRRRLKPCPYSAPAGKPLTGRNLRQPALCHTGRQSRSTDRSSARAISGFMRDIRMPSGTQPWPCAPDRRSSYLTEQTRANRNRNLVSRKRHRHQCRAICSLAQYRGVLRRVPDRVIALLRKAGIIDHQKNASDAPAILSACRASSVSRGAASQRPSEITWWRRSYWLGANRSAIGLMLLRPPEPMSPNI